MATIGVQMVGGILVPRTHLHLFGRRVLELLDWSPEKRQAVIDAGRSLVLNRYTPARERERLAAMLSKLFVSRLPDDRKIPSLPRYSADRERIVHPSTGYSGETTRG